MYYHVHRITNVNNKNLLTKIRKLLVRTDSENAFWKQQEKSNEKFVPKAFIKVTKLNDKMLNFFVEMFASFSLKIFFRTEGNFSFCLKCIRSSETYKTHKLRMIQCRQKQIMRIEYQSRKRHHSQWRNFFLTGKKLKMKILRATLIQRPAIFF